MSGNSANVHRLGYIGRVPVKEARNADSWFTPIEYIDSVRAVLDIVDLDPFSSPEANAVVKADRFFTETNSAFDQDWNVVEYTRVFMNPPYSSGLCRRAVNRFIDQYHAKKIAEGIVLVNNATDTRWFHALVHNAHSICFTDHRISFWNADHKDMAGNTRGQAFFYFGPTPQKFAQVFEKHGCIVTPGPKK